MLVTMKSYAGLAVAILIVLVLRRFVGPAIDYATHRHKPVAPAGFNEELWKRLVYPPSGAGAWIGGVECFISLAAFWSDAYLIAGGWLAFKLASKWENWKNIVQVPSELPDVSATEYFVARIRWGEWVYGRFVIGTALNLLIGLIAAFLGRQVNAFLRLTPDL